MTRHFAVILVVLGFLLIGFAGIELYKTHKAQTFSLTEAYTVLNKPFKEVNQNSAITFVPKKGEVVGILEIPKIKNNLPIIEGTDEDELEKGVGHIKDSAFPTQNNQIVLSGHRDTVLRRMGELELGDKLLIHLPYGRYSYEITDTKIVKANDRTIIKNTFPHEELIITTCYPFTFIGAAPERYIITALPVETTQKISNR